MPRLWTTSVERRPRFSGREPNGTRMPDQPLGHAGGGARHVRPERSDKPCSGETRFPGSTLRSANTSRTAARATRPEPQANGRRAMSSACAIAATTSAGASVGKVSTRASASSRAVASLELGAGPICRGSSASSLDRGRPRSSTVSTSRAASRWSAARACSGAVCHAATWCGTSTVTRSAAPNTAPTGEESTPAPAST